MTHSVLIHGTATTSGNGANTFTCDVAVVGAVKALEEEREVSAEWIGGVVAEPFGWLSAIAAHNHPHTFRKRHANPGTAELVGVVAAGKIGCSPCQ